MKKGLLFTLLDLLFLIVFNVIFFTVIGTSAVASIWISYGFIHFAYIMVLLTPLFTKKKTDASLFGMSILTVSAIYFLIELVFDGVLIFTGFLTALPVFLINLVSTGIYLAILISSVLVTDSISMNAERHQMEKLYIKNSSNDLLLIMAMIDDKNLLKRIETAYDIISSSPAISNSKAHNIEKEIEQKIGFLKVEISNDNVLEVEKLINQIIKLAKQRNIVLKTNIN